MSVLRRFAARLLSLTRPGRAEDDLGREIHAHLRLLEDDFVARGMSADEARYAARRAFGGVEQAKERHRDARSFRWLAGWPMDLKLGARMLVKYPGLTLVGVVALAAAIGAGAAYMEFVTDLLRPSLTFPGSQRVVGIVNWNAATGAPETRALHAFARWRRELTGVVDLGASYSIDRNLITEDGRSEPVRGACISPSAFRVMPSAPLLGRPLVDDDERAGAIPAVVLGEGLWRARFGSDPAIVGRSIRLGRDLYTVVGVMPRSFGFPINHTLWIALRETEIEQRSGEGLAVMVFGRLAAGATYETAQAELTAVGERAGAQMPAEATRLRPVIKPYVAAIWAIIPDGRMQQIVFYTANLLFLGLLGICGANVATLVFARVVTREAEITVRAALGASRGRIVCQLFAEALVLSAIAAAAGLAIAWGGSRWAMAQFMEGDRSAPPFWFSDRLSADTVIYAALLAVVAAAIVGVVPALKATGPRLQARLKTAGAGGPGLKFGGVWTAVVIGQIAMTVIFLMGVVSAGWNARVSPYAAGNFAFRAQEYVTVDLVRDREAAPASYTRAYLELERRLEGNPAVASVTHTTRMPGGGSEFILDRESLPSSGLPDPLWVRSAFVGADFFATFDAPIVSGRGFTLADVERARPVVVVDETFVRTVAGGRDPVGMRVRQRAQGTQTTPWLEVVGVVRDLGIRPQKTSEDAMLYRPGTPGETGGGVYVVVRARGDAAGLLALVRRTAAEVDPALRLDDLMPLPEFNRVNTIAAEFMMRGLSVVAAVALLLSSAGIYALMSFTLSRRTREIGIRAALGAAPRSIVAAIFSRAFAQVGLGVVAGSVPGYLLVAMGAPEVARGGGPLVGVVATLAVAGFVTVIAGAACALPARRALRIHPTDALRAD